MFEFRHPHFETTITDNSFVNESTTTGNNSSVLFQPYFSDEGEDNVIKKWTNLKDFLDKNGTPNFKNHGQPIYNLTAWLAGAPVYGVRLMPQNSTYSNMVLSLGVKESAGDSGTAVTLSTKVKSIADMNDKKEFESEMHSLNTNTQADEEGFENYSFLGFRVKGRGSYGNNYSIRIKSNNSKSKSTEYRCYDFSVFKNNVNGVSTLVEGPFTVSFNPKSSNLSGTSLFISTIVNSYSNILECKFNEDDYNKYIAKLKTVIKDFDESKFDIIFAKDEEMNDYKDITLFEGSVPLDQASGVSLSSGNNGDLDTATTASERINIMNDLYLKAYSGNLVPEVLNKRSYPYDVVLDANYPIHIKNEILNLCKKRQDCFPFFDTGLSSSYSVNSSLNFRKTDFDADTYLGALYGPSKVINDPYGLAPIEVTFTYILATKIPAHDLKTGLQYPLAGSKYGLVGTANEGELSFNPDEYQQEDLYNAQINYVTRDYNGMGEIGSQLTLQKKLSSLSDINNVRSLLKIVRAVENIGSKYKFEFSDDMTLSDFQSDLDSLATIWTDNRTCTKLKFTVYQTDYDKVNKTARVKVELVFNMTIEIVIIDVNIGR